MLLYIKVFDGLNSQFISELGTAVDDLNISFSEYVLQAIAWPSELTATSSFVLPEPLKLCAYNFELFYKKSFNSRKLTWLHHQFWGNTNLLSKNSILRTEGTNILSKFQRNTKLVWTSVSFLNGK